jgi:hypothetical protein
VHVHTRLHSRLKGPHRALGLRQPSGKLDFEVGHLMRYVRDTGKDVTRQQAHSELVRRVKSDRVLDPQAKR